MFERLQDLGYTGVLSILKDLRPPRPRSRPVQRYETASGEQMQIDWGEMLYEHDGTIWKLYGLTAVLSYSRMRVVWFCKRCDTPSLIRGIMVCLL